MQIIIAILLIGNYGLMDIFMLKGWFQNNKVVRRDPRTKTGWRTVNPWSHSLANEQNFKTKKVPFGDINWFYWVILGLLASLVVGMINCWFGMGPGINISNPAAAGISSITFRIGFTGLRLSSEFRSWTRPWNPQSGISLGIALFLGGYCFYQWWSSGRHIYQSNA